MLSVRVRFRPGFLQGAGFLENNLATADLMGK
jgi:hypothetical protein